MTSTSQNVKQPCPQVEVASKKLCNSILSNINVLFHYPNVIFVQVSKKN